MNAELPVAGFGSDAVAAVLRELDFGYVALVPGASFRGLHDSIVNYLGNENPTMLLCLHEEHSIAIAHGYAKVTERPMLAIVHSNVGLMHATMAFFNAWCDRVPIVCVGATGPWDAARRRPWIDWIHTAADQGALVRDYTKWDDQPASPRAAVEALLRATQIAATPPYGPVYVNLDVTVQEQRLEAPVPIPDKSRFRVPSPAAPAAADVAEAAATLRAARSPLVLFGRMSRSLDDWNARVALVEKLNARAVVDIKVGSTFPTEHPLFAGMHGQYLTPDISAAIKGADAILSLDSVDLAGVLATAYGDEPVEAKVVSCSLDRYLHRGWGKEYQGLPPVDQEFVVAPDILVRALVEALGAPPAAAPVPRKRHYASAEDRSAAPIGIRAFSRGVAEALAGDEVCYVRLPLGANGADFSFDHPLSCLGGDGGAGIGAGPGLAVGAALALRGTNRVAVAVLGDGDFLMGATALWTAVANGIPLLIVVANNHSYFNDEVHQERVAVARNRPVERKWIGQRLAGPAPDVAEMAHSQGAVGLGPVVRFEEIAPAVQRGLAEARAGKVCVVDVHVLAEYDATIAAGVGIHAERNAQPNGAAK